MITSQDMLDWLKALPVKASNYYCGTLDQKKEKSFGLYNLKTGRAIDIALGGEACTKTGTHGTSILVHWTTSTRETENVAYELYNAIRTNGQNPQTIGGENVTYIMPLNSEPVDVGTDSNGICEYVIEILTTYNKNYNKNKER